MCKVYAQVRRCTRCSWCSTTIIRDENYICKKTRFPAEAYSFEPLDFVTLDIVCDECLVVVPQPHQTAEANPTNLDRPLRNGLKRGPDDGQYTNGAGQPSDPKRRAVQADDMEVQQHDERLGGATHILRANTQPNSEPANDVPRQDNPAPVSFYEASTMPMIAVPRIGGDPSSNLEDENTEEPWIGLNSDGEGDSSLSSHSSLVSGSSSSEEDVSGDVHVYPLTDRLRGRRIWTLRTEF